MSEKRALFVATVFKFLDFEKRDMELLKDMGYEIHTATNMDGEEWLRDDGALDYLHLHKHQIDFGRSPMSRQNINAYRQLKSLFRQSDFSLMHCHTPVAAAIARLAARKARKEGMKVIYTSHGFHFHKASSLKDWLVFYPIEWFMAFFTDMIITINKEDFRLAQNFHTKEKRYIPGVGVDVGGISGIQADRQALRKKYGIPDNAFMVLSIGELSDRKNHEVIIKAIAQCGCRDIYYLICGEGQNRKYLSDLIQTEGLAGKVILAGALPHEEVLRLCHACDIGALPSKIEGLGLAGIETLAAGKPLVASNVHGIKDYVVENETGLAVEPDDIEGFRDAICKFCEDQAFCKKCQDNAVPMARNFDKERVKKLMSENYHAILNVG